MKDPAVGRAYCPPFIRLHGASRTFFLAVLDGRLEVRRLAEKFSGENMTAHTAVRTKAEIEKIETNLLLLEELLDPQRSFEKQYEHIKGRKVKEGPYLDLFQSVVGGPPSGFRKPAQLVFQAAKDPVAHFKTHRAYYDDAGISEPSRELHELVFMEELRKLKSGLTLDWRCSLKDINSCVRWLTRGKITRVLSSADQRENGFDMLEVAGAKLRSKRLALMMLQLDGSDYPVFIVSAADVLRTKKLAKQCGIRAFRC